MSSILLPTDFSESAAYALDAAVLWARRMGCRLYVVHGLAGAPPDWEKRPAGERALYPKIGRDDAEAFRKMQDLTGEAADVEISIHCLGGALPHALDTFTRLHGIDLIVMGSHGASGKSEFFIGSQTQKVIRTVHCSVLVIKHPLADLHFDQVVFASGFQPEEEEAFLRFKGFVKHFLPKIHLVEIHRGSIFDPPQVVSQMAMERFQALCSPLPSEWHIFRDLNVEAGIRHFSRSIGAGLIGISNHHRHPLRRMLTGSNVEALVNHSEIPVLSIDYEE